MWGGGDRLRAGEGYVSRGTRGGRTLAKERLTCAPHMLKTLNVPHFWGTIRDRLVEAPIHDANT